MSLLTLGIDCLREVAFYLHALDLGSLYLTGNSALLRLLTAGGADSFIYAFSNPLKPQWALPRMSHSFPLRSLRVDLQGPWSSPTLSPLLGLEHVTKELTTLELCSSYLRNYLEPLVANAEGSNPNLLKTLFPSLTSLTLASDLPSEVWNELLFALPASLLKLDISFEIQLESTKAMLLLPNLTFLHLVAFNNTFSDEFLFPANLANLALKLLDFSIVKVVPKTLSLTKLQLEWPHMTDPYLEPEAKIRFPPSLVYLDISVSYICPSELIPALPRGLTYLKVYEFSCPWTCRDLTGTLPPTLKHFILDKKWLDDLSNTGPEDHIKALLTSLPKDMLTLDVKLRRTQIDISTVKNLPRSLTHAGSFADLSSSSNVEALAYLPRNLREVRLPAHQKWAGKVIPFLPQVRVIPPLDGISKDLVPYFQAMTHLEAIEMPLDPYHFAGQLDMTYEKFAIDSTLATTSQEANSAHTETYSVATIRVHDILPPSIKRIAFEFGIDVNDIRLDFGSNSRAVRPQQLKLFLNRQLKYDETPDRPAKLLTTEFPTSITHLDSIKLAMSRNVFRGICKGLRDLVLLRISGLDFALDEEDLKCLPRHIDHLMLDSGKIEPSYDIRALRHLPRLLTRAELPTSPKMVWKSEEIPALEVQRFILPTFLRLLVFVPPALPNPTPTWRPLLYRQ